ncbi:MFS transporter [Actinophytocola sp.]|uniref:MFS transporter n=1 Tax=Actinophytocola sp. TaxID=1872138 RepID=UPI002D7E79B8|nr:MFS transporter [Actinophytocola sp.]HET9141284.1 MFS transporter [Actinophytocola sp.]
MTTTTPEANQVWDDDSAGQNAYPKRWLALFVLLAAAFMDLLDATIVTVALPAIRADLGASYAATQWLTAGYTLAFGLGLITGGRLGDRFGRKRIFMVGIATFTATSALCGLAQSPEMLVASRLLQGAAAALMVPQIMATVFAVFPPKERASASGAYGAIAGLAAVAGPLLGGLFVSYDVFGLGWRGIFLVNVPIGIIAFFAAGALVPETKSDRPLKMDLIGVVLITLSLLMLLFPLVQGTEQGWPAWMFLSLVACPFVLGVYVLHARAKDRRDGSALVPLRLFKDRGFTAGLVVLLVLDAAMIGFSVALSILLQIGYDYSPIKTGLAFLPWAVGGGISAGMGNAMVAKLGRNVPALGAIIMAVSMVWIAWSTSDATLGWLELVPGLLLFGIGMGFLIGPAFTIAGAKVDYSDAGAASGSLSAALQIGSATGVAVLGVLFFNILVSGAGQSFDAKAGQLQGALTSAGVSSEAAAATVSGTRDCFVDRLAAKDPATTPASCTQAAAANPAAGQAIATTANQAKADAFSEAFRFFVWFAAGALVLTALICQLMPRRIEQANEWVVG